MIHINDFISVSVSVYKAEIGSPERFVRGGSMYVYEINPCGHVMQYYKRRAKQPLLVSLALFANKRFADALFLARLNAMVS